MISLYKANGTEVEFNGKRCLLARMTFLYILITLTIELVHFQNFPLARVVQKNST